MLFTYINTPEELFEYMCKIEYGYLGKNKLLYRPSDSDYESDWYSQYRLQNPDILKETMVGNCWDLVEFERVWFENHGYEVRTYFEMLNLPYENPFQTHSFLVYKDKKDGQWCWFEVADAECRGIHKFKDLYDLLDAQFFDAYLVEQAENGATDEELKSAILTRYEQPMTGISAEEYILHCVNSPVVMSKEVCLDLSNMFE